MAKTKKLPPPKFKRLAFLEDLLNMERITQKQAGSSCGITQAALSKWFSPEIDDARISQIEKIVNGLGFQISFELISDDAPQKERIKIEKLMNLSTTGITLKRLSFLRVAMASKGLTEKDLAAALGQQTQSIYAFFRQDDMQISKVFVIAQQMHFTFKVTIYPEKETDEKTEDYSNKKMDPKNCCHFITEIHRNTKRCEIIY